MEIGISWWCILKYEPVCIGWGDTVFTSGWGVIGNTRKCVTNYSHISDTNLVMQLFVVTNVYWAASPILCFDIVRIKWKAIVNGRKFKDKANNTFFALYYQILIRTNVFRRNNSISSILVKLGFIFKILYCPQFLTFSGGFL